MARLLSLYALEITRFEEEKKCNDTDTNVQTTPTFSGTMLRWAATWVRAVSRMAPACGAPKPLKAVQEGILVLHKRATALRLGMQ